MKQPTTFLDLPILALAQALTPTQALNLIKVCYWSRMRGATRAWCCSVVRSLGAMCSCCHAVLLAMPSNASALT
jgi:hypothetical protein